MSHTEQTNQIAWAIHDEGKEIGNVATQHAHVQSFRFRKGGELAAKNRLPAVVARQGPDAAGSIQLLRAPRDL